MAEIRMLRLWLTLEVDVRRLEEAGLQRAPEVLRASFDLAVADLCREFIADPAWRRAVKVQSGCRED
jgi:hypothetical protein